MKIIWDELGIESVGELLYAVNENRLVELKGFGQKTQEELKKQLEYFQKSKNQYHYAALEKIGLPLLESIKAKLPDAKVEFTGAMRRCMNTLERIEVIIGFDGSIESIFGDILNLDQKINEQLYAAVVEEYPVHIYHFNQDEFGSKQFRYSASSTFMDAFLAQYPDVDFKGLEAEKEVFDKVSLHFIPAELREAKRTLLIKRKIMIFLT